MSAATERAERAEAAGLIIAGLILLALLVGAIHSAYQASRGPTFPPPSVDVVCTEDRCI